MIYRYKKKILNSVCALLICLSNSSSAYTTFACGHAENKATSAHALDIKRCARGLGYTVLTGTSVFALKAILVSLCSQRRQGKTLSLMAVLVPILYGIYGGINGLISVYHGENAAPKNLATEEIVSV